MMDTIHEHINPIYSAMLVDLPEVEDVRYGSKSTVSRTFMRRPYISELTVYSFPQTWGSTALGFGGIGGSAMTTAQTVVVMNGRDACVYFGGRLAYGAPVNHDLMDDIAAQNMADVMHSGKYNK